MRIWRLGPPKQTPFLLRYYPKAVAGNPDELNRLTPRREIPFEIQPAFETTARQWQVGGGLRSPLALRDGKPIPNAIFTSR